MSEMNSHSAIIMCILIVYICTVYCSTYRTTPISSAALLHNNRTREAIRSRHSALLSSARHLWKLDIEEQEAAIIGGILFSGIHTCENIMRIVTKVVKSSGDTVATMASGTIKLTGSAFKFVAHRVKLMSNVMMHWASYYNDSVVLAQIAAILNSSVVALQGLGRVFIWIAEAGELITTGILEAILDSFSSLRLVSVLSTKIVRVIMPESLDNSPLSRNFYVDINASTVVEQQQQQYLQQRQQHHRESPSAVQSYVSTRSKDCVADTCNIAQCTCENDITVPNFDAAAGSGIATYNKYYTVEDNYNESISVFGFNFNYFGKNACWFSIMDFMNEVAINAWLIVAGMAASVRRPVAAFAEEIRVPLNTYVVDVFDFSDSRNLESSSVLPFVLLSMVVLMLCSVIRIGKLRWLSYLLVGSWLWKIIADIEKSQKIQLSERSRMKSIHNFLSSHIVTSSSTFGRNGGSFGMVLNSTSSDSNCDYIPPSIIDDADLSSSSPNRTDTPKNNSFGEVSAENSWWANVVLSSMWNGGWKKYGVDDRNMEEAAGSNSGLLWSLFCSAGAHSTLAANGGSSAASFVAEALCPRRRNTAEKTDDDHSAARPYSQQRRKGDGDSSGFGRYASELLRAELESALVATPPLPDNAAVLYVKRFDLGTAPPLLKRVQARIRPVDAVGAGDGGGARQQQCRWVADQEKLRTHSAPEGDGDGVGGNADGGEAKLATTRRCTSCSSKQKDFVDPASSFQAFAFSNSCDRLDIAVDFVFASENIDVALAVSLRSREHWSSSSSSDSNSGDNSGSTGIGGDVIAGSVASNHGVMPEVIVTLKEIVMEGTLILEIEITDDYPFLGNATAYFLELPSLAFALSGFGGVDLSSFPPAFNWLNETSLWLLEQFTYPLHTTLDLRHTLCSSCDGRQQTPSSSSSFVAHELVAVKQLWRSLKHFWKESVNKWGKDHQNRVPA